MAENAKPAVVAVGKRNGNVQQEYVTQEDHLKQLDPLVAALNAAKNSAGPKFDRKGVAQLLAGLQQFMEDALGVNVSPPPAQQPAPCTPPPLAPPPPVRAPPHLLRCVQALYKQFMRLPAHLFQDYSVDGPLAIIAGACGEFMKTRSMKRIDWQAPNLRAQVTPAAWVADGRLAREMWLAGQRAPCSAQRLCPWPRVGAISTPSAAQQPMHHPRSSPASFAMQYVELFGRIRAELLRSGYVRTPQVYVHPSNGPAVSRLQDTVRSLKGEVAQSEGPAVTHVVHPLGAKGDPNDGQRYARTLEVGGGAGWGGSGSDGGCCWLDQAPPGCCLLDCKCAGCCWLYSITCWVLQPGTHPPACLPPQIKGSSARVHWLCLPDSYDEWLPLGATPGAVDPPRRPPRGPWHVTARWVADSEKYNEWMNPGDYETPEAAEEAKRKREAGEEGEERKVGG